MSRLEIIQSSDRESFVKDVNEFIEKNMVLNITYNTVQDFNNYNCWCYIAYVTYMPVKPSTTNNMKSNVVGVTSVVNESIYSNKKDVDVDKLMSCINSEIKKGARY